MSSEHRSTEPDVAIRVRGLSKRYHLGERQPYRKFGQAVVRKLRQPFTRSGAAGGSEYLWAVKDVSFDVARGEILGLIGENGAGKSTLLKLLSRITHPTEGRAEIFGRVGSLLEVGTGFHPELNGRENVYLNGAILGMTRSEITKKYDEIVDFAQVEEFMKTPVKHYSTGMRVRLAFSVAAHLDPEILFVDEVLSVGDASFQAKCLKKMDEVANSGRTIIFVSHNLGAVTSLCTRCLWIDGGRIAMSDDPSRVVETYLAKGQRAAARWDHPLDATCGDQVRINSVEILGTGGGGGGATIAFEDPIRFRVEHEVFRPQRGLEVVVRINDMSGTAILSTSNQDLHTEEITEPGRYTYTFEIPGGLLRPSRYLVTAIAAIRSVRLDQHEHILGFDVIADQALLRPGVILPKIPWTPEDATTQIAANR